MLHFAVFTKHSNQILNFVWTFLEDNGKKKIVLPWMNLYDPFHAKRTKNACSVHKRHTLSLNLIHYIASRQEFKIPYRIAKSPYTMGWNSLLRSTILIFSYTYWPLLRLYFDSHTKGGALYLVFLIKVIVIVLSAMFVLYIWTELEVKHCPMTRKTRYNVGPLVSTVGVWMFDRWVLGAVWQ